MRQTIQQHYNTLITPFVTLPVEPVEGIRLHTADLGQMFWNE
jgi:hypothetical protein